MVVGLLTVDLQGPVEVAKFLVPPLLDGEVSLEVLGPPLQQAGGGLFLTQLVVDLNQRLQDRLAGLTSGRVNDSVLFCWIFTIKDHR